MNMTSNLCAVVVCCFIGCGGDDGPASGESSATTTSDSSAATTSDSSSESPSESSSADESDTTDPSTTDASTESSTSADESSDSTGDAPSIPAACEAFGLPAEQGQETVAGHFTTVAEFEVAGLESWLGEVPADDQAILVLATHAEYDCNRVEADLNHSYGYSRQLVYVFPGPIAAGEYAIGVDVRAWSEHWLGDGGGNGGGGGGELDGGTLTIVTAEAACVTGTQEIEGGPAYGFAVSTDAACM